MEQRPGHACGVFGVYAPGQPVAHLAYLGLFALQHRGQESAGIAVSDGETITVVKDMGLVTQVFDERRLAPLDGHLAIGHNRYSTTGSSTWRNAQPVYRSVGDAGFALGHNGNLTNIVELAQQLGMLPGFAPDGVEYDSTTDSALIAELVAQEWAQPRSDGRDLEAALDIVGAHFVREVEPGEIVVIDASGMHEHRWADPDPKLCLFEFVYFARPDTSL